MGWVIPSGSASVSSALPTPGVYEFRVVGSGDGSVGFSSATVDGHVTYDTISGKTTTAYQRNYRIPLPQPGPWDIRMRRLTADSTSASLRNPTWFDSYTEIVDAKLRYPNSALVGIQLNSSQFKTIPRRGYHLKGIRIRVPTNYDPVTRVYTGVWDGTFKVAWSNNPAWCFYDLVTSTRYGLGDYIDPSQADKWALYDIAQYCDELVSDGYGGQEPRFTCNMYMQTREEAYKVIGTMASIFRGMAWWQSGAVTASADKPSDAVMLFTRANVVDGVFNYQGSSIKARHTVALVTWNDPEDQYKQKIEYVEDTEGVVSYGITQTDVMAAGCTSRGQAHRLGRWILYSERLETETVTFRCGLDGVYVSPGAVIHTQDPVRAGERLGGRVMSATVVSVEIDHPVVIVAGKTYTLSAILPDGKLETVDVTNAPGTTTSLSVAPFTVAPQNDAIWVMAVNDMQPEAWRVVGVVEPEKGILEITALSHRPDKYDAVENNLVLEPLQTSNIKLAPAAPTNLHASDYTYADGNLYRIKAILGWDAVPGATQYRVSYRVGADNPVILDGVLTNSVIVDGVREEDYTFTVTALNAFGKPGPTSTLVYTVLGLKAPPQDVTGFVITRRTYDLLLEWNAVTDVDLAGYEVRVGPSWDAGTVLTTGMMGTAFIHDQDEAGTYYYHVRAIDGYGTYSANVSTVELVLLPPVAVEQFDAIQSGNRVEFRWLPNPEPNIAYYEIREGAEWSVGVLVGQVNGTTYSTPSGAVGTRNFMIKAVATPGVYGTVVAFSTTEIAQPTDRNMIWTSDRKALGFPGVTHDLTLYSTNLVLESDRYRGEYLFNVDLGVSYRAQVTIATAVDSLAPAGARTWSSSGFAWASLEGQNAWALQGSPVGISSTFQMAAYTGLTASEVDGWALDGSLVSHEGTSPSTAVAVTYGEGRYNQGVTVGDFTKVDWATNVPEVFRHCFWIAPVAVHSSVLLSMTGVSGSLTVRYSTETDELVLEDHAMHQVKIPVILEVGVQYLIVVVQTATDRKLALASRDGTVKEVSVQNLPPVGEFTAVRLY